MGRLQAHAAIRDSPEHVKRREKFRAEGTPCCLERLHKPLPRKFLVQLFPSLNISEHKEATGNPSIVLNFYNLPSASPPICFCIQIYLPTISKPISLLTGQSSPWLSLSRTSGPTPLLRRCSLGNNSPPPHAASRRGRRRSR